MARPGEARKPDVVVTVTEVGPDEPVKDAERVFEIDVDSPDATVADELPRPPVGFQIPSTEPSVQVDIATVPGAK